MKQQAINLRPTVTLDQLLVMLDHITELDGGLFAAQLTRLFASAKDLALEHAEPQDDNYGGFAIACCADRSNDKPFHSRDCNVASILHILDPAWSEKELSAAFTAAKRMNRDWNRRKAKKAVKSR